MIKSLYRNISYLKRKFKSTKKSYSYGGCDLLINYIFRNNPKGFYIDIGCQHPVSNNNTYLLHKKGWTGINIDLDDTNIELFNYHRSNDNNICACLSSKFGKKDLYYFHSGSPINSLEKKTVKNKSNYSVKTVNTVTLDSVLQKVNIDSIDYLNLDVEGHEIDVLNGFNIDFYKPKIISVEFLDLDMSKLEFKYNDLNKVINSEIYKYFTKNNYKFINWNHADLIFVHNNFRD
tara:strand:- start:96 stop:794 length:699 start_codon:yes stop_codon:yes gene_type:complete